MSDEKFPVEPLHGQVIIKPFAAETKTEGGLFIPDSVQQRPSKGVVMGKGEDLEEKPIQIGDAVFHVKGAGTEFEYQKEQYFLMRYSDCLAKIPKN